MLELAHRLQLVPEASVQPLQRLSFFARKKDLLGEQPVPKGVYMGNLLALLRFGAGTPTSIAAVRLDLLLAGQDVMLSSLVPIGSRRLYARAVTSSAHACPEARGYADPQRDYVRLEGTPRWRTRRPCWFRWGPRPHRQRRQPTRRRRRTRPPRGSAGQKTGALLGYSCSTGATCGSPALCTCPSPGGWRWPRRG
jgi:hypothetical protein